MKSLSFAVVLILFWSGLALPAASRQLAGHVPAAVASGKLAPLGRVAGTNQLRLAISLPLRNAAALTNLLRDIYDPASPQFHHYLTPAAFAERFGPTPADYAAVTRFARTNGFTVVGTHSSRLVLDVTGRAAAVERAFQVRLHSYRHPRENRNFFAPDAEPTVTDGPAILQVSGLDNYSLPRPRLKLTPATANPAAAPRGGSGPGGYYLGNDFRTAYVPGSPLTGAGQSIGLLQFDGFYPGDVTNYANAIGLDNVPPVVVVPVDGGVSTPGDGEIEVALDIEMALAMAPGMATIYVYEAPNDTGLWVDLLSRMADDNLASQLSCSWGGGPSDAAMEQIFQQMAAQGQSFFNASGDSDALTGAIDFPTESPNITQVGGTQLTTDSTGNYASETVWNRNNDYGSSGGISPTVAIPAWQLGVGMTANHGSATMRNIPDVALTAENVYVCCHNGSARSVGGTSCAAPLWAGFTALANQQAGQLGQPAVGFLNPTIYAMNRGTNYALAFHDITTGNNLNTSSPTNFYAVTGFDLCTGWGTPNGTNLINALTMPDYLGVSPQSFAAHGRVGGPFSQTEWVIVLTNSGAARLDWTLGGTPAWLAVAANSGTLPANSSTSVHLQLLKGADALPTGDYIGALAVTNQTTARVQIATVTLNIGDSIVQNGGFETGDFTGWTLMGDTIIGYLYYNVVATEADFPGIVHSGSYGAFLGEGGYLATLTQSLPTVASQKYLLSFWLSNPANGSGQQFIVRWNGTELVNLNAPPAMAWTRFQFVVTAGNTNAVLQFAGRNDANYFGLDEVSVVPIPPVAFGNVATSGTDLQFTWNALAGLTYQIEFTTNLAPVVWQNLTTLTAGTNVVGFVDTNVLPTGRQRFYRLVLP